ncbi:DUF4269 domain-containing protein [Adhaeribacter swui]|uniref:DUF4269 domain-containing protein n=1 Tax=Adhaeribacter swui TaxID=2086471 RepID=A0A7G7GE00_9BACT|nr:DUF4269 domain-containing protein [Adhaeribacter swui]QNF35384.1 DUF4269 domain-containing protein [Adhaeribacter swui]
MDFTDITYLQHGSPAQQQAYRILTNYQLLDILAGFTPVLVGTFPLDIQVPGSDLDVICYCPNIELFKSVIQHNFAECANFTLREKDIKDELTVIANFTIEDLPVEIFGQNKPVAEQLAFRHMQIEYQILLEKGNSFKQHVRRLKAQGFKTEPAFCQLLDLPGDPYQTLLNFKI